MTRDTLARCEAAVAFVLAGHAALLWATADVELWAWSIAGFLGLLGTLGLVGIFRPSSDAVAAVRGALAVATVVLVGEATGALTGLFWAWFMALAFLYPLILPVRAAAGSVLGISVAYGLTVHSGTAGFALEDALLRGGVLGAIGIAGLGMGMVLTRLLGDREDAESRAREIQGLLDAAYDTVPTGMALLTLEGEIVRANQALADFLGRSVDSLVGTGWGSLVEPKERQRYTSQVANLVSGEIWSFQAESRFVLRDRRVHYGLVGMSLVHDGSGWARYLFAHVTDITSRVKSEEKVRRSEAHYRNLFDVAPVALLQVDLSSAAGMLQVWRNQGVSDIEAHLEDQDQFASCSSSLDFLGINEAARRLFRVADHNEFIAAAGSGGLGPGYCEMVREVLGTLWEGKPSLETGVVLTDLAGGVHEGMARLAVPIVDGSPEYRRALLTFTDHTAALRSRSELESIERRMRAVMTAAPVVLFAVDRHGVFTVSEGQGLDALGLRPGEVVGRSVFEVYRDVPQVGDAVRAALAGESVTEDVRVGDLAFQTRYSPIREDDEIVGVIGVAVDISEQMEASDQLAESVRAKDRFVAVVSHELRTPLTAVVGFAHQLQARVAELGPEETAAYVEMICEQAVEAGDLVEDLLVASRTESGNVTVSAEPTGLWEQVDAVLGARTFDVPVTLERTGAEIKVVADPMRVRQIIRNLFDNAERYGGDRVTVRIVERDGYASLFVIDNGSGVPEEEQSAMFEPFLAVPSSERDPDSVGLGLSVSRSLARLMGGDLTYVYYRDHSFFEVKLPTA